MRQLPAAEAVFDAERSLHRVIHVLNEVSEVAASSLRVLDDAAIDSFYAHREKGRQFYLESAGENLARLRTRSETLSELSEDLGAHLDKASRALERAGIELRLGAVGDDRDIEVMALRTQLDVLGEVLALARPLADQIARHARQAAVCAEQTDAQMLLDTRVQDAGQNVSRADEDVSIMRSVVELAQSRVRASAALAGSLSFPGADLPVDTTVGGDTTTTPPWSCGPPRQTHRPNEPGGSGIAI